jgi:hypothetical protein
MLGFPVGNMEKIGQISINSEIGKDIYNYVSMAEIINIVEIGTWNGYGSTQCIYKSIVENKKQNYNVFTIESSIEMFNIANNINEYRVLNNFNLILGRIIEKEDVVDLNCLPEKYFSVFSKEIQKKWLIDDLKNYEKVPNVLEKLPSKIDLLILDGGEFSTYKEFISLKDRSDIIILDDVNCIKCFHILEYIKNHQSEFIIIKKTEERNGTMTIKCTRS